MISGQDIHLNFGACDALRKVVERLTLPRVRWGIRRKIRRLLLFEVVAAPLVHQRKETLSREVHSIPVSRLSDGTELGILAELLAIRFDALNDLTACIKRCHAVHVGRH